MLYKMSSKYDKNKIELNFLMKMPTSILPTILFEKGFYTNNMVPTEFYILDEDRFSQYMKPEYETADFYSRLYVLYDRANVELRSEFSHLLHNEKLQGVKNDPFETISMEHEKEEVLRSSFFSSFIRDRKKLVEVIRASGDKFLAELLMMNLYERDSDYIGQLLVNDEELNNKTFKSLTFCKLVSSLAKEKNKRFMNDIEKLRAQILDIVQNVKRK
jgi:hypothetical protein